MKELRSLQKTLLLQAAADGLSAEEMEEKYGIPAPQALLTVKEMLKSRDAWTDIERKRLLLVDLQDLKVKLKKQMDDEHDSADASVLLRTLREIGNILDKQSAITDEEMNRVSSVQARELMRLIVAAFDGAKEYLAREYPEVSVSAIEEVFQTKLLEASRV